MRAAFCLVALLWSGCGWAQVQSEAPAPQQLRLVSEHLVEGMAGGNLSALAWCGDALLGLSDRDDDRIYSFEQTAEAVWQAKAEPFVVPPQPTSGMPWGLRVRNWAAGLVRGGELDFEGLACDGLGNRYLVSESLIGVLRVDPVGHAEWLELPDGMLRQARASGMLLRANALLEGIAVNPEADTLWLAAERERRGLLVLHRRTSAWRCTGGCILQVEGGQRSSPLQPEQKYPRDFSDLSWYAGKLFSLERLEHRICRRTPSNGEIERCWSFSEVAQRPENSHMAPFGTAEGLALDEQGAWLAHDNDNSARADGERRPAVWRLAAPKDGWLAR